MAQRDKLQCRTDSETCDRVERFQTREGFEHRSEAVEQLLKVGLREQRNPLVWRAKSQMVGWANMLVVSAVVVAALGATTRLFVPVQGLLAATVLLCTAAMLLASLEVARGLAGANEIGVRFRDLLAGRVGDD